jgi:hypothetical protein
MNPTTEIFGSLCLAKWRIFFGAENDHSPTQLAPAPASPA